MTSGDRDYSKIRWTHPTTVWYYFLLDLLRFYLYLSGCAPNNTHIRSFGWFVFISTFFSMARWLRSFGYIFCYLFVTCCTVYTPQISTFLVRHLPIVITIYIFTRMVNWMDQSITQWLNLWFPERNRYLVRNLITLSKTQNLSHTWWTFTDPQANHTLSL